MTEQCNIIHTYAEAFRSLGHETYTAVLRKESFNPDSSYDEVLLPRIGEAPSGEGLQRFLSAIRAWVTRLAVFLKALRCDMFIFLYGSSLLPKNLDYPILKLFGKRIVSVFLGSDIRYWYAYEQEVRRLGWEPELRPFIEYQKTTGSFFTVKNAIVRSAERYADLIISHPDMGQLQTRPYMRANVPIDLSLYRFRMQRDENPLILHAPSIRRAKGTEYVLAAVEELRKEGLKFEFRLIENVPNRRIRSLLSETDIVVESLFTGLVGTLGLEAMASGCVVLERVGPRGLYVPSDCPAVTTTINDLADQLRKVVLDGDLRRRLALDGRRYVEKYHDHIRVAQQILDWTKPRGISAYDFVPHFSKSFTMPPELLQEERRMQRPPHVIATLRRIARLAWS
jgi:glycosyltransferase involved in cell wall biosynthesis